MVLRKTAGNATLGRVAELPLPRDRCPASMLGAELRLRDARAHDACGGGAAGDDVPGLVHDLRPAPLLVGQRLHAMLPLLALDELHVGRHTALGVVPGEEVNAQRVAVETCERDAH